DIINEPIGRSPSDFRRRLAGRGARGELREAVTEYKVLKLGELQMVQNSQSCALTGIPVGILGHDNFAPSEVLKYSVLEVYPKTGRTHQIRVHMKFINAPIVCDKLYAPNNICPIEFGRLMLHAKSIEFKTLNEQIVKVEAPLPEVFSKVL
ncbi:MAG: RNA pseudouridine synthase, partial [bacterium]|nr:RNA pseudouridine synthase [bacterium]